MFKRFIFVPGMFLMLIANACQPMQTTQLNVDAQPLLDPAQENAPPDLEVRSLDGTGNNTANPG